MKKQTTVRLTSTTLWAIALIVLLAVAFSATVLFAYFSADREVGADVNAPANVGVDVTLGASETSPFTFASAGDEYSAELTVSNPNAFAISYQIRVSGILNRTLRDALIVKFDGRTLGILSKLPSDADGIFTLPDGFLLAPATSAGVADRRTHTVSFELHVGAGNLFADVSSDVKIEIAAQSYVGRDTLFVRNQEDFLQAIRPETLLGASVKTIYLVDSVDCSAYQGNVSTGGVPAATASDVVLSGAAAIDLNGKTLSLNTGLFFRYSENRTGAIVSSAKGGAVTFASPDLAGGNGIVIDTPNAYVEFGNTGKNAANFTAPVPNVQAVDSAKLALAAKNYAENALSGGISKTAADFLGGYGYYAAAGAIDPGFPAAPSGLLTFETAGANASVRVADGAGNFLPETLSVSFRIRVTAGVLTEESVSVGLLTGENLADAILKENNAYLYPPANAPADYRAAVSRDLYLPTRVLIYNAEIEWFSSDPNALTDRGKYRPDMEAREVELTAVVSFEGVRYVRRFQLTVSGFTASERLALLAASESVLFVKSPDVYVFGFDAARYRLENVYFEVSQSDSAFLEVGKETVAGASKDALRLKSSPADSWTTEITVFANGIGETEAVSAKINVTVRIERSVSVVDEAQRYAESFLPEGNTFSDFYLPTDYNAVVSISYEVINGAFHENGNSYENAENVRDYVSVAPSSDPAVLNAAVAIDAEKVPVDNRTVYLVASLTYNGTTERRVLSFSLAGILHNNEREIADYALYVKLLNKTDANGDFYITRDEADGASIAELSLSKAGISDLKGIEYFRLTGSLDLSYNRLYSVGALAGMRELKSLNLAYNNLSSASALTECVSLVSLDLSNNKNLADVTAISGLSGITELRLHNDSGQGALSDISSIREMTGLKTLTVYNTGVSSVLNNNLNAILTAYFSYYDSFGRYPDYYIAGKSTRFTVAEANVAAYRAKNAAINAIEPIYEFANVVYLPQGSGGYAVEWSSYPAEIIEIVGDRAYVRQPLSDVDATLTAEIDVGISSHRILRSFPVISRGAGTYSVQIEDGGAPLDAAAAIPDPNLRYLLFREFDTDGNGSISYSELIRSVDNVLSFDRQNLINLEGIQYFTGITGLNLSGNPFSDVTPLNTLSLTTLILQNSSADLTKLEPKTPGQTGESAWKYTTIDVYGSTGLADSAVTAQLLHLYNNHLTEAGKIFKDEKNPNGEWKPYDDELKRVATNFWGTLAIEPGEQVDLPVKYTWLVENDVSIAYTGQSGPQNQIKITFGDVRENGVIVAKRLSLKYENAPAVDTNVFAKIKVTYVVPESGKSCSVEVLKSVWLLTDSDLKIEMPDGSAALLSAAVEDSEARKTLINAFGQAASAAGNLITRKMMTDAAFDTVSFTSDSTEGLEGLKVFEGIGIKNLTVSYGADAYRIRNADGTAAVKKLLAPVSAVADTLETLTIGNSFADLTALPELPKLTKLTLSNCPRIVMSEGGRNVFDQSVAGAVLPVLTDLSLSDNYITYPSALTGLRKVTKLTLYNNPCSKTPLTESVIGTVYGNLSDTDQAASQFYIVNPKTRWTPGGTLASTVKDAGATLGGTALRPEIHGVNFVRDGDAPTFPASVTVNGSVFQIFWRTGFSETVSGLSASPVFVNKTGMTAYVSVEAFFPELSKSIFYYFAVAGSGTEREPYVNFDLFETTVGAETALADPYFTYYCFQLLHEADPVNKTGIYLKTVAQTITALDFGNTISERNYAVSKLNGIENFTALRSLNVNYNVVRELTPIKDLAELRSLEAKGNEIVSLWLSDGATSVFQNLTKLELLKIGYNNNVEDYKPVVYAGFSGGNGTLRTGLENLKSLFLLDVSTNMSAWNNVTLNGSDYVKTLSVWLDAVKGTGDFAGVSMFLVDGSYRNVVTDQNLLSRYKGSLDVVLNDIPEEYVVTKDSENNFAAMNIVRTITRGGVVYTVDYEAYSAAKGDFIKVSGDRISLQNVANLAVGVKLSVLAKVYGDASDVKFYKEIILDASVVNDSIPLIEVTAGEKTAYLGAGRAVSDADFTALSDGNFTIAAEKLVLDAALLRFLFASADQDQNKILSVAERAAVTSIRPENEGIKRVEGLELFPNVSDLFFYRSHIERIPDFVRLPYTSVAGALYVTFQEEDYLTDISGFLTLTDASGAPRVTSFSAQSCGAFGQQNASVLGALPLTSLSLTATGIYDFSFLLDLTDTLTSLKINDFNRTDHNYPGFYEFYNFRDTIVRFLFEAANPIPLYTENYYTHVYENNIQTIGWDDKYLYPYLPDLQNLKKGDAKTLATEISAFGKTYGVGYELVPDGVTDQKKKITLSGGSITIPSAYPNDYFTVKAIRGAYSEEIAVYFSASDEGTSENLADDGLIYDSSAGTRRLSEIFPDIGLRVVLLALFDKNGDGTIALDELNKIPASVELGLPSSGYYSAVTPVAISSFEGIGYFNPYFKGTLKITGANTPDLSPLGALENVKTIDFNAVNYIFRQNDKSTPDHANINDWGFLAGMKSLTSIFIMHTNSTATGLERIVDSKSITVINSNNSAALLDYSTVSNAIAYAQSRNGLSDYPSSNLTAGSRQDEKKAATILSALAIGDLMKTVGAAGEERKSEILLKDQTAGAALTLPTEISYQSATYAVEYVAASSNVTVLGNVVTALGYENNRKARIVARIRMDGALYERLLEFEVVP